MQLDDVFYEEIFNNLPKENSWNLSEEKTSSVYDKYAGTERQRDNRYNKGLVTFQRGIGYILENSTKNMPI